jgi:MinD superfamily P-loop ATPase
MREVVIISGKGGTGKTSLTAAFAHLAENKVICDLDVDAPDLHILLEPEAVRKEEFHSGYEAEIDPERCTGCGTCMQMCRFGAVTEQDGIYAIDPLRCEGCKVCVAFCPERAVDFNQRHCGSWQVGKTRFGTMVHAQLFPGEENSGRLVTLLKAEAREIAENEGRDLVLCDGAPGIGCPVISSLSGTELAAIVTEPTPSGRHDLERVAALCEHFRIKVVIVINKYDLNLEQTAMIEDFASRHGYPVVAKLPHDPVVTVAMVHRKAVSELRENRFNQMIREAWDRILDYADSLKQTATT